MFIIPYEELKEKAAELLEVDPAILETALATLAQQDRIMIEEWPEGQSSLPDTASCC